MSSRLFFLNSGITFPVFNMDGNMPPQNERLTKKVTGLKMYFNTLLTRKAGMSSEPHECLFLSLPRNKKYSSSSVYGHSLKLTSTGNYYYYMCVLLVPRNRMFIIGTYINKFNITT